MDLLLDDVETIDIDIDIDIDIRDEVPVASTILGEEIYHLRIRKKMPWRGLGEIYRCPIETLRSHMQIYAAHNGLLPLPRYVRGPNKLFADVT